jgi:hypothetical protein
MRRAALFFTALIFAAAVPVVARATVLMHLSIEDLSAQADLVVIAQVLDRRAGWDVQAHSVRTWTRVRVVEEIAGVGPDEQRGKDIVIEQEGGFLADFGVYVPGNAPLAIGERALLFLIRGADRYFIHGMELGKLTVLADRRGVDRVTRTATVETAARNGDGMRILAPELHSIRGVALRSLLARVRRALRQR